MESQNVEYIGGGTTRYKYMRLTSLARLQVEAQSGLLVEVGVVVSSHPDPVNILPQLS